MALGQPLKYAFIRDELMAYPLSVVCWVLSVTQSGFHAWRVRTSSKRAQERDCLSAILRQVFDAHRGRYGAPRVCRVLRERHGYVGNLNRIQKLMRVLGLRAKAGRKYKATTDSGHSLPVALNLLGQDFSCDTSAESTSHAKAPNQVWLSDITYLWTREGWLYVCAVLDLFTRRIVGWAIAEHMTRQLVLDALHMADTVRKPAHASPSRQPIRQRIRTRLAGAKSDAPIHERHGKLLRQRTDGELLALIESRGNPRAGLCNPRSGQALRVRLHRGLVQHHAHAFKLGLQIAC